MTQRATYDADQDPERFRIGSPALPAAGLDHNAVYHRHPPRHAPRHCERALDAGRGPAPGPLMEMPIARRARVDAPRSGAGDDRGRSRQRFGVTGANIRFEVADFVERPWAMGSYDVIASVATLHHSRSRRPWRASRLPSDPAGRSRARLARSAWAPASSRETPRRGSSLRTHAPQRGRGLRRPSGKSGTNTAAAIATIRGRKSWARTMRCFPVRICGATCSGAIPAIWRKALNPPAPPASSSTCAAVDAPRELFDERSDVVVPGRRRPAGSRTSGVRDSSRARARPRAVARPSGLEVALVGVPARFGGALPIGAKSIHQQSASVLDVACG